MDTMETQVEEEVLEPLQPDNQLGLSEEEDLEHVTPHDQNVIHLSEKEHEHFKEYAEAGGFNKDDSEVAETQQDEQDIAQMPESPPLPPPVPEEYSEFYVEDPQVRRDMKAEVFTVESDEEKTAKGTHKDWLVCSWFCFSKIDIEILQK